MTTPAHLCPDPWHHTNDAPHATYHDSIGGGWECESYGCLTCGFRTMTRETYVPVDKPCGRCGRTFEGMPDVDGELCDDCFAENLSRWVTEQRRDQDEHDEGHPVWVEGCDACADRAEEQQVQP